MMCLYNSLSLSWSSFPCIMTLIVAVDAHKTPVLCSCSTSPRCCRKGCKNQHFALRTWFTSQHPRRHQSRRSSHDHSKPAHATIMLFHAAKGALTKSSFAFVALTFELLNRRKLPPHLTHGLYIL